MCVCVCACVWFVYVVLQCCKRKGRTSKTKQNVQRTERKAKQSKTIRTQIQYVISQQTGEKEGRRKNKSSTYIVLQKKQTNKDRNKHKNQNGQTEKNGYRFYTCACVYHHTAIVIRTLFSVAVCVVLSFNFFQGSQQKTTAGRTNPTHQTKRKGQQTECATNSYCQGKAGKRTLLFLVIVVGKLISLLLLCIIMWLAGLTNTAKQHRLLQHMRVTKRYVLLVVICYVSFRVLLSVVVCCGDRWGPPRKERESPFTIPAACAIVCVSIGKVSV